MFKLAVSNTVVFQVKGTVRSGADDVPFDFTLEARRDPQDAVSEALSEEGSTKTSDYMAERVTGWKGQKLVLDADGKPAEFSLEAFAFLCTLPGMSQIAFRGYLAAIGAKGKEKN